MKSLSRLEYIEYGDKNKPCLVFLHGFLGSAQDWLGIIEKIKNDYHCLALDLPRHGASAHLDATDFIQVHQLLQNTLDFALAQKHYFLIGYSLGGRLALSFAANINRPRLAGLVIESSHLGLAASEQAARLSQDLRWAQRFQFEPLENVLRDWYQQPLFHSLSSAQKCQLIEQKARLPKGISALAYQAGLAQMLIACSLSKQAVFSQDNYSCPLYYLCGELDNKLTALIESTKIQQVKVEKSGHNVHFEQPDLFIHYLTHWVDVQTKREPLWQEL